MKTTGYLLAAASIFLYTASFGQTPDFDRLADSCFHSFAANDTARFNRLYPRLTEAYEQKTDPEMYALRQELLSMRNSDQGIRLLLLEARQRFGPDSPTAAALHAEMKRIDTENARRVRMLIDEHGWIGKEDLGEDANETLFLCIQHVDDLTIQEKYLPLLKQAVETGNAEGWHYAFLTDRIRMNRGEKQVYGTQTITRPNGEVYVVPLEDPGKVDSLRRSIGLEPMAAYLGKTWNPETYKRDLPAIEQQYKAFTESRKMP